jgi:hypothetical protein
MLKIIKKNLKLFIKNNKKDDFEDSNKIILERIVTYAFPMFLNFDYNNLKSKTLDFVKNMNTGPSDFDYKYSNSCKTPNIYSSAYACMILSLFGELEKVNEKEKNNWSEYFSNFQNNKDGLFYDKSLQNENFNDSDWWGARHLAAHLVNVFISLEIKPRYKFYFLEKYYNLNFLKDWLDKQNWSGKFSN